MILMLLFSCASKIPLELENPYQYPHVDCDQDLHFWSRGIGDTANKSIDSAHRNVAEQVVSHIQSETNAVTEYEELVLTNGDDTMESSRSREYLLSEINTITFFSHNELIRNVIPPMAYEGQYYVLACLNRQEAGMVLTEDLRPRLEEFEYFYNQASVLYSQKDISGFTMQYNQALGLSSSIVSDLYIIRSVTGAVSPQEMKYRRQWIDLREQARAIRSQITLGLQLTATQVSDTDRQVIQDEFRKGLTENGFKVVNVRLECSDEISHFLEVRLKSNCSAPGAAGILCQPELQMEIQECSSSEVSKVGVRSESFSGQDYYKEETALYNAINRLPSLNIETMIGDALRDVFPLSSL